MQIKKTLILSLLLGFIVASCGSSSGNEEKLVNNSANLSTKERQYFANGKKRYATYCASCHMEQGEGLGKLIPPLQKADYLLADVPGAARVIKHGLKGPIQVNGTEYNQPMPANPRLTNLEIAELLTFIANSWGNEHGGVTTEEVATALEVTED